MRKTIALAFVVVAFVGCYNDKYEELYPSGPVTCDTTVVTYAADVKPILDSKCNTAGCHNAGGAGGNFTTYAGIKAQVTAGKLIGCITWTPGFSAMPQGQPKLPECDINKITRWVNQGALNN